MAGASDLVRPWRGVAPEERVAARRERLLEAALEVFTADGFHSAKVRDVCREAGLTERYFYESFKGGKEALLVALADEIVTDLLAAVGPGLALVRSDLETAVSILSEGVVASLTDDPRRARILFVEVVGVSRELEDRRRVIIGGLADVVRTGAADVFGHWVLDSVEFEVTSRALIGAMQELFVAYVRGELALDRAQLIDHFGLLLLQAAQAMASRPTVTQRRSTP